MASLFGKNRLRELAQKINTDDIQENIELLETWHNDYHNGSLKKDKETSREQAYNQSVFIKILGYEEKPTTPYSFEPKSTTDKGQLPDAVIGWTDVSKGIKNVSAVVELKGAGTDLDRPQRREKNMSPVQQAFKYKTQYRNCPFVIVSNFYEFRLYQDNQLDYEVWTLDELVSSDNDYLAFKTFFVLLNSRNFITESGASKTERLLSDIRIEQQDIGRKFYKEYREARLQLLRDIYANNPNVRSNFAGAIEKAQKIIDRVVFACFAEDRGLLPDNTMQRVILSSENSSLGLSMWSILKGLFDAIDHGSEKLEIPIGYNGGLFKTDKQLNNLQISDESLRPIVSLSRYDFKEELSVSILGHIFEQSISDLEEIKNKVSQNQGIEEIALSRRKRDGIFYTPDYIVRYIVENSLGRYLRDNEERFKTEAGLHGDINDANYAKREKQAYGRYQDFLHTVKVVDPACGSGAFLVHVFDYLLAENKRVGDILGNSLFSGENYIRDILQNNIYGVDLNEESVEITKLSLWLKSAEKGKKLTALDNNIKCGNSLIDDEVIAGNKAFDWQRQFPEIFVKGGFDVVVGNPPYVDSETMVKHNPVERSHIAKRYVTAKGNWDLFVVFIQKGMDVLKTGGYASMIIPNKILSSPYASALREYVSDRFTLVALTDVSQEGVFDVDVYPVIVNIGKKSGSKTAKITQGVREIVNEHIVDNSVLPSNWALLLSEEQASHSVDTVKLGTLYDVFAAATVNEAYELKEHIEEDSSARQNKIVNTGTIDPYTTLWGVSPINYIKNRYLNPHVDLSRLGKEKIWYSKDKIIVAGMSIRIEACYSRGAEFFPAKSTTVICEKESSPKLKALLALLNSTYVNQLFHTANSQLSMAGGYMNVNKNNISQIDIPRNLVDKEDELVGLADALISMTGELQSKSIHFQNVVKLEYGLTIWPTKLNYWWQTDFEEFVKVLKTKLSLDQKDELYQLYKKYQPDCTELYGQILDTNSKVDDIAIQLYGVTTKNAQVV